MRRWVRCAVAVACIAPFLSAAAGIALASSDRPLGHTTPEVFPAVVRAVEAARRGAQIPSHLAPPIATIKLFPPRDRIPPACIARDWSTRITSRVCHVGQVRSKKLLVLFGDSHAFMWLPAVLALAHRDGWAVVPLIRFGCTPGYWFTQAGPDVCRAWFRWGIDEIRRLHPTVTLLGGSIGEQPSAQTSAAVAGTISAAQMLKALGPLVVIGDPEGLANDPVPCLAAAHVSLQRCSTAWPPVALVAYNAVERATKSLGVGFLQTRGLVCFQRECPAVVGHTIVWMDNSHLTGIYSAEVAGAFRTAFLRARP